MHPLRDRQVQGIQGSQRVPAEPGNQPQRRNQMLVSDRVNLKEPAANIIFE